MRKSVRTILVLVLLCVVAAFWANRRHKRHSEGGLSNTPASETQQLQAPMAPPISGGQTFERTPAELSQDVRVSKEEQFRAGLQNLNHVPIAYYGQVVDQDGSPLPQTRVKWSVAYNNGTGAGHKNGEVVADSQAYFSISGQEGKSLSVLPERTGYKFVATNGGGIYSHLWPAHQRYVADPAKPEILTMWKLQGAEPLIRLEKLFFFPPGVDAVQIDLATGQLVKESGDIKVIIQKAAGDAKKSAPQDWSLIVEPLDGGIREVTLPEFRNLLQAPERNYKPRYEFRMEALNPAWSDITEVFAFVQTRGGRMHSKLHLSAYLHAGTRGYGVQINALTNPNNSRNWEEDPAKIKRIEGR